MKFKYITIEREYGSGATEIAKRLSEETGIPCYGREIIEIVSEKYNIPVESIERYEESATNSFITSLFTLSTAQNGGLDMLSTDGKIYVAEQNVIKELSDNGSCIFIGRCASEALSNKRGVLKVFVICSDNNIKNERIKNNYGICEKDIESIKKKIEKRRSSYYTANTSKQWKDFSNYDLVLDSAKLGVDGCVSILKSLL